MKAGARNCGISSYSSQSSQSSKRHYSLTHIDRGNEFAASATAHFATGDVTVLLNRYGRNCVSIGSIPVPAGNRSGGVEVDVNIVYNGVIQPVITRTIRG